MSKKHLFIVCISLIFSSCAKEKSTDIEKQIQEEAESIPYSDKLIKNINVRAEVNTVNIFKETLIRIYDEENHNDYRSFIDWDKVSADSVVWHIDDALHYNTRSNRNLTYRGITFNKPGDYKFDLLIYKNSKVIKQSSLNIRAVAEKDFFNVNWKTPPSNSIVGQSYSYKKGYRVDQTYLKGQYPCSAVNLHYEDQFPKQTAEKEKEYLLELAQATFGTPELVATNNKQSDLDQKYSKLFKNKFNYKLIAIWENRSSSIALVGTPKNAVETYQIIAEPIY